MRVLDILMVVLIAARTWTPSMTQDPSTIREKLLYELQKTDSNPHSVSASELATRSAKFQNLFVEECQRNGGPMAFDGLVKGFGNYARCLHSNSDLQHINTDIASAQSNSNWKPLFNKYCPKSSVLVECSEHFTGSIKTCLAPEERDSINKSSIFVRYSLELFCHDGGDAIASFLSTGGHMCYVSKIASLNTCRLETLDNYPHFDKTFRDSITFSTTGEPIANLDQEACKSFVKWQTCFGGVFRGCENPKSADAVDAMLTTFEKLTNCKNFTASSYGSANSSVISLVSGLLITTAMSMYLRF